MKHIRYEQEEWEETNVILKNTDERDERDNIETTLRAQLWILSLCQNVSNFFFQSELTGPNHCVYNYNFHYTIQRGKESTFIEPFSIVLKEINSQSHLRPPKL